MSGLGCFEFCFFVIILYLSFGQNSEWALARFSVMSWTVVLIYKEIFWGVVGQKSEKSLEKTKKSPTTLVGEGR